MDLIYRKSALDELVSKLRNSPIVAILGPHQCGKSTLAKLFMSEIKLKSGNDNTCHFFDLENPVDLAKLDNPLINLQELQGYVIIDEVQRQPNLYC